MEQMVVGKGDRHSRKMLEIMDRGENGDGKDSEEG